MNSSMDDKIVYFASDFHLGIDTKYSSKEREKMICRWMDDIKASAKALYLVGDIFDFWFEYKSVVPKGFLRLQGKLAEWTNDGIPIFIFKGNHDMWMFDYFEKELGIPIIKKPISKQIGNHQFFIGHGDGLGPGDHGYKMLKKIFSNKICQWLFSLIHPNIAFAIANFWSKKSRTAHKSEARLENIETEWLFIYANDQLDNNYADYYIFGHRHIPIDQVLKNGISRYINLGDWMNHFTYAAYDGKNLSLKKYIQQ